MIIRGLDSSGDMLFGKGLSDYKRGNAAIGEDIETRILSFLGDCFFATTDGIDWFNLLGGKDLIKMKLAIAAAILNTDGVTGLIELSVTVSNTRSVSISYSVTTGYSGTSFESEILRQDTRLLISEDGNVITTEDGISIGVD